jgi:catechol 2,3-dioxygenase-like lactoylglutathione lyase family enzyme
MTWRISGTPVAFINVSNRDHALKFYRDALGLVLRSSDDFGDFIQLDGGLLRLTVLPDFRPGPHPVLGWNVHDIRSAVETMRTRGVEFTIYPGMGQDELGIWTGPDGHVQVAWFADPDGNVLSLSQA